MISAGIQNHWVPAEIGAICDLINGRAFKPREWTTDGLPIVRIQNLNNPNATFNHFNGEVEEKFLLKKGDLLFAWSGTPGTSFGAHVWHGPKSVLNQHIFRISFDQEKITKRFLRYAINQKLEELIMGAHGGVGLRHVTKGKFEKTQISFPSLAEQKQIAAKLDELLAQVDTLKTRLDAIPAILKRFRQSVLAAAVSGRLTEEWRKTCKKTDWSRTTLLDVVKSKPRNGTSPKGVNYETPYRNLTLSATTSGHFIEGKFKYINIDIEKDSYLWLKTGDILIQRANTHEYVGVSAIYKGQDNQYVYPDLMMKCSPNDRILGDYLHHSLLSQPIRKYFRDNATGTAGNMPKINQKIVCSAPIDLPPIKEQTEIVRRVEQLFRYADQIEQRLKHAQARVDHLTQSILAKAFRGELTADWREQNPDLISGENSAQALLARIKLERAKLKPNKRRRSKKATSN